MTSTAIASMLAWEAIDSRGTPTVACEVRLASGARGQATVPSSASKGSHAARELCDGDERYGGRRTRLAVANVNSMIARALGGVEAENQATVDDVLRELDGTADVRRLGANAVLAVSIASALAAADAAGAS